MEKWQLIAGGLCCLGVLLFLAWFAYAAKRSPINPWED